MAVAYDNASSTSGTNTATLSWSHTVNSGPAALVVGVSFGDVSSDAGWTIAVALDPSGANTAFSSLSSQVHSNNQDIGLVQLFGLANVSAGTYTVQATVSGGNVPDEAIAGVVGYTGAGSSVGTAFGTAQTNAGNGSPTITFTGSTAGNMVFGVMGLGNTTTATTAGTQRWRVNVGTATAAGNSGGADIAGGGSVTLTWTPSDWFAIAAVEVKAGSAAASIPWAPFRAIPERDPGESYFVQKDRRNANLVATAANDLAPPLLSAWQADALYSHLYSDSHLRSRRLYPEQRRYISGPALLSTAQLENELLGGATTWQRQQPAVYTDRREVPQQRLQLRDQGSAAAPDTDVTQGGYGPEWRWWRRDPIPPQQRIPVESLPGLLNTALLENELLGGATTELRTNLPASHVDRREVPQYTLRESAYGLLSDALLEVPPPLPWWYGEAAYLRTPWLRLKQTQADQSSAAVTNFDPTQAGYSLRHVWRRDLYAPTQRPGIQNPDDVVIVGTGATGAWWGVDDTAHHFNHWLPTVSDPSFYTPPVVSDPTQAGYGPRWMWYRLPTIPQQRQLESAYGLLDQALLEVPPPLSIVYEFAATHQRLPWLRIKQQQYDQSTAAITTDLDPTLSGGYGSEWRWWYRSPVAPVQRERESDPNLLLTALLENELLGSIDDSARHRAWFARPWFGLQHAVIIDQGSPSTIFDVTQAGLGPEWRRWHRPPVIPQQRPLESDPNLLLTALLENELLGGWQDILNHRMRHADRRMVPQQRNYPQEPPMGADPLLVMGADIRRRLAPLTHAARWVLRLQVSYLLFQGSPVLLQGNVYPPRGMGVGNAYPRPSSGSSGNVYPHSSRSIDGSVG